MQEPYRKGSSESILTSSLAGVIAQGRIEVHGRETRRFESEDDHVRFGSAVEAALNGLLVQWSKDGYEKEWGSAFASEAHLKLEQALVNERRVRKTSS